MIIAAAAAPFIIRLDCREAVCMGSDNILTECNLIYGQAVRVEGKIKVKNFSRLKSNFVRYIC